MGNYLYCCACVAAEYQNRELQGIQNFPDLLFARIAQTYNRSDVFNTQDLKEVAALYAEVVVDDGETVVDWRNTVSLKYGKFPGIRPFHDFVFTRNITTRRVIVRQRRLCYSGTFASTNVAVIAGHSHEENVIPGADKSYLALNYLRSLSEVKMDHLRQMFDNFIPKCLVLLTN